MENVMEHVSTGTLQDEDYGSVSRWCVSHPGGSCLLQGKGVRTPAELQRLTPVKKQKMQYGMEARQAITMCPLCENWKVNAGLHNPDLQLTASFPGDRPGAAPEAAATESQRHPVWFRRSH